MSAENGAEVIVVGGGVVGLAVAVELGLRGVRTVVYERDLTIPDWHPRMFQLQARTFEHFRRWGVADEVRAASPLASDVTDDVIFAKSLTSTFIARPPHYDPTGGPDGDISSGDGGFVAQWLTETVLERKARALPSVTIHRGVCVDAVAQDETGVDVEVTGQDGQKHTARARFVIGSDGAGSIVRKAAGIEYEGEGEVGHWLYVPFNCSGLADAGLVAKGVLYVLFRPDGMVAARWLTPERWDMQVHGASPGDLTDEELDERVRVVIGRDDIPFERGPVAAVRLQEQLADHYRNGRLFIAGNAAHLLPHTGGHNGNIGIGDSADLGWKLAAVLQGWGGEDLLDSYETERRAIAIRTRDTVMGARGSTEERLRRLSAIGFPDENEPDKEDLRTEFREAIEQHAAAAWCANGVTLDQRYTESSVVIGNGVVAPEWRPTVLSTVVAPGHRAPHVSEGNGMSVHDAFGPGYTLLRLGDADSGDGFVAAARARGVPLDIVDRPTERYLEAYGARLTLIRPDWHIAWSGDAEPPDVAAVIDTVTGMTEPPKE